MTGARATAAIALALLFGAQAGACGPAASHDTGAGGSPPDGAAGAGGGAPDVDAAADGSAPDPDQRHLLLRDEARSVVSYVELGNPAAGWHVPVSYGRDMQLVGGGRFMLGTDNGYEERLLADGSLAAQQTAFAGTLSAHRLRDGNTVLAGVNWQGGTGIVLVEVDAAGAVQHRIVIPGFTFVRLVRQTPTGSFLVTADDVVLEADALGQIVWRAPVTRLNPQIASHIWQALRIPSGDTVVSTGYGASIQIFGADGSLRQTITGPASVTPNQFVGFQILPSGDFVVANWLGHSGEVAGVQLLEYDPQGTLVWSHSTDPLTEALSLHHVIVLDGLDTDKLNVDDTTGVLVPVTE